MAYLDPIEKKILMNSRHRDHFEAYIGSELFTMAHEVGHWDMHVFHAGKDQMQLPFVEPPQPFLCRANRGEPREIQANKYASYLLMTHDLLMQTIANENITLYPTLYRLKDCFGVSISAFTRRLSDLGLIFISDEGKIFKSKSQYQGNLTLL